MNNERRSILNDKHSLISFIAAAFLFSCAYIVEILLPFGRVSLLILPACILVCIGLAQRSSKTCEKELADSHTNNKKTIQALDAIVAENANLKKENSDLRHDIARHVQIAADLVNNDL